MTWSEAVIEEGGTVLRLTGSAPDGCFHAVWLRDTARDAATRDPLNGQRRITLADIPDDLRIADAQLEAGHVHESFAPGGHVTAFALHWLEAHCYDRARALTLVPDGAEIWDAGLTADLPIDYLAALQSGRAALRAWLAALTRFGVAQVSGVPIREGSLFGYVRETNYGRPARRTRT